MLQSDVCIRNSLYDQKFDWAQGLISELRKKGEILGADYASIAPNVCVKTCFKRAG